jgi:flagellar biosynthesis protein FlhG
MTNIWPIGGGKGGSGKSFLAGNLGISLAKQGKKTLLIDVDLGAANLHTIIGISPPARRLSDFVGGQVETLEETIIETAVPKLFLISGAKNNLSVESLTPDKKTKIYLALSRLSERYDYVILDLGAGTSLHTIDFFTLSDAGVVVTAPEPTSIENVFRLVRSVYYRKIRQVLKLQGLQSLFEEAATHVKHPTSDNPEEIFYLMKDLDPDKGRLLDGALKAFQFGLVVNQLRNQDDPNLGTMICRIIEKHLGLRMRFLGNVRFDDRVHDAVCRKVAFVEKYPYTNTALDIRKFGNNLDALKGEASRLRSQEIGA